MKKIYQTIIDKGHGNCMQAAVASLLELELDEVPNFIELEDGGFQLMKLFFKMGYDCSYINKKESDTTEYMKKIAKFDGGVNGYFYASVPSQTFENVSHAVIIDTDLNIVHDPNPNQRALNLTPDDVEGFYAMHDMIIGKTGKLFKRADWEVAAEEEQTENTWKVKKLDDGSYERY